MPYLCKINGNDVKERHGLGNGLTTHVFLTTGGHNDRTPGKSYRKEVEIPTPGLEVN